MNLLTTLFIFHFAYQNIKGHDYDYSCPSPIYCHGELLETIQLAGLYADSKTFVDKKLVHSQAETLANFKELMSSKRGRPNKIDIEEFVAKNFIDGNELDEWAPPDFKPEPDFLNQIQNVTVRSFAKQIVSVWPKLSRIMNLNVMSDPVRYSFIPVRNGFVVPGGRFREYYYWDSYWVIKGLLISDMTATARGMLDNFVSLVARYGFVPNGGRVYYLNRSQPPLLTAMAHQYYKHTGDTEWIKANIRFLDKELKFWLENRTINIANFTLARYCAESLGPRPESYAEDYNAALPLTTPAERQELYIDIKSAAESGWDFSSRWFIDKSGGNKGNLTSINTRRVIPVDLNAILYGAFKSIAAMYSNINDLENAKFWTEKAKTWRDAIESLLWNEEDGIWYDLDLNTLEHRRYFYPSSIAPLWTHCYDEKQTRAERVVKYLQSKDILNYLGGVPTSLEQTGEQWDFPNAWPPLQDVLVDGLATSGSPEAAEMATTLAKQWIEANIRGYLQTGEMFEKYDAENPGRRGGGGEYNVQTGFGWSNGVVLKFIYEYYR